MLLKLTPQQIVGKFNRREAEGQSLIYNRYYLQTFNLVSKLTPRSSDAEDLVTNIFIRLLEHKGHFDRLKRIKAYLYFTTYSVCLDYLKKPVIEFMTTDAWDENMIPAKDGDMETGEAMAEFQKLVFTSIEKLPLKRKKIFLLYYTKDMSNAEIAKRLHISEKTVKNQKTIALKYLKMEIIKTGKQSLYRLIYLL